MSDCVDEQVLASDQPFQKLHELKQERPGSYISGPASAECLARLEARVQAAEEALRAS